MTILRSLVANTVSWGLSVYVDAHARIVNSTFSNNGDGTQLSPNIQNAGGTIDFESSTIVAGNSNRLAYSELRVLTIGNTVVTICGAHSSAKNTVIDGICETPRRPLAPPLKTQDLKVCQVPLTP